MGNFLGDFVKGSDLTHLPSNIQQGIRLHRAIDSFTDSHNSVSTLRSIFPRNIRRVSGVVIDIYFDHLLSLHWEKYNNATMKSILDVFYDQLENTHAKVGGRFPEVKMGLLHYKWLHEYEQKNAVIRAFHQIEKRLKYKITFANEAADFIDQNHDEMSHVFNDFYPQLIGYCKDIAN